MDSRTGLVREIAEGDENPFDIPIPEVLRRQAIDCAARGIPAWDDRNPHKELRNWARQHAHKHVHGPKYGQGAAVAHFKHQQNIVDSEDAKRQKDERRRLKKIAKASKRRNRR